MQGRGQKCIAFNNGQMRFLAELGACREFLSTKHYESILKQPLKCDPNRNQRREEIQPGFTKLFTDLQNYLQIYKKIKTQLPQWCG